MIVKKIFSITDKDKIIIPYLESKDNMSRYIVRLIREDMGREEVYKTLKQLLKK